MSKRNLFKECCDEIMHICELFPGWNIATFIKEEEIDVTSVVPFLSGLKEFRQQLEMDNHVIVTDDELEEILNEGMRIHEITIKNQRYGED